MSKRPESSEVKVFNDFVSNLTGFQKQLDEGFHHDGYLIDRLLTAIDISSIQDIL